jgi:hypothetical protein
MLKILNYFQNASQKYDFLKIVCQKCILMNEWIIPHPNAKSIMVLVCPFTSVNIQIKDF